LQLESKTHETGIIYPRAKAHVKRVSEEEPTLTKLLMKISLLQLSQIDKANKEAVNAMNELGISFTNPGNHFKTFGCTYKIYGQR